MQADSTHMTEWQDERPLSSLAIKLRRVFTDHPHAAGETYWQHFRFTMTMAARFTWIGVVITLHGIFPFLFTTTASTQMEKLYRIMKSRAQAAPAFRDVPENHLGDYI